MLPPDRKSIQSHIQGANFVLNWTVICWNAYLRIQTGESAKLWMGKPHRMMVLFTPLWYSGYNLTDRRLRSIETKGIRSNNCRNPTRVDWILVDTWFWITHFKSCWASFAQFSPMLIGSNNKSLNYLTKLTNVGWAFFQITGKSYPIQASKFVTLDKFNQH